MTASEALERLLEGNRRFMRGETTATPDLAPVRRAELVAGQNPFAVILGCADSRVPAELVFDQGLGDLFVVRVAGNVLARSQVGSIEFAVEVFGTPLVVVLGHSQCGAVKAAVSAVVDGHRYDSPNVRALVERIHPAVDRAVATSPADREALLTAAVRENVLLSVERLTVASTRVQEKVVNGEVEIVGAEYRLEDGSVRILDDAHRDAGA